jgi:hypothetical protein
MPPTWLEVLVSESPAGALSRTASASARTWARLLGLDSGERRVRERSLDGSGVHQAQPTRFLVPTQVERDVAGFFEPHQHRAALTTNTDERPEAVFFGELRAGEVAIGQGEQRGAIGVLHAEGARGRALSAASCRFGDRA